MVHDADKVVRCRHCGEEALILVDLPVNGQQQRVPLCGACFTRIQPPPAVVKKVGESA